MKTQIVVFPVFEVTSTDYATCQRAKLSGVVTFVDAHLLTHPVIHKIHKRNTSFVSNSNCGYNTQSIWKGILKKY